MSDTTIRVVFYVFSNKKKKNSLTQLFTWNKIERQGISAFFSYPLLYKVSTLVILQ